LTRAIDRRVVVNVPLLELLIVEARRQIGLARTARPDLGGPRRSSRLRVASCSLLAAAELAAAELIAATLTEDDEAKDEATDDFVADSSVTETENLLEELRLAGEPSSASDVSQCVRRLRAAVRCLRPSSSAAAEIVCAPTSEQASGRRP
jgi:hypothetical protein